MDLVNVKFIRFYPPGPIVSTGNRMSDKRHHYLLLFIYTFTVVHLPMLQSQFSTVHCSLVIVIVVVFVHFVVTASGESNTCLTYEFVII